MQAALEPMTPTTTMDAPESGVEFNKGTIIKVTVVAAPSTTPNGPPVFEIPMVAIPGSGSPSIPAYSLLLWTLVDGSGGSGFDALEFSGLGLEANLPENVELMPPGVVNVAPRQRLVLIENKVLETTHFQYTLDIDFRLKSLAQGQPLPVQHFRHDPTIIITTEPIDG